MIEINNQVRFAIRAIPDIVWESFFEQYKTKIREQLDGATPAELASLPAKIAAINELKNLFKEARKTIIDPPTP